MTTAASGAALEADAARGPVLLLYFHPSMDDTVRSSVLFANASGELRARGIDSEVVETFLEWRDPAVDQATRQELARHLERRDPSVVVVDEVPSLELFELIRRSCGACVVLASPYARFGEGTVDFVLLHFTENPRALTALVERVLSGHGVDDLPNVARPCARGVAPPAGGEAPHAEGALFVALPDVQRTFFPAGYVPEHFRVTVYCNTGCPYAGDASATPFFEDTQITAPANPKGCTFCVMGGDYRGQSSEATVDRIVQELEAYRAEWPEFCEVIVRDQATHRFLGALVRAIDAARLTPMAILVSMRADTLRRARKDLEEACRACEGTDVSINLYLVGAENFSGPELLRLNKGYAPEALGAAIALCRDLADRYPESFMFDRYPTWSLILFGPWTSLEDLRANVRAFEAHDILEFSRWMGQTKLRLYENQTIFSKAKADGLLVDRYERLSDDSARVFGYAAEHPWRFADPYTEQVHRIYAGACDFASRASEVALLSWAVERVACSETSVDTDAVVRELGRLAQGGEVARAGGAGPEAKSDCAARAPSATLQLGATCNNGCQPCVRDRAVHEPGSARLEVKVRQLARRAGRLILEGREPTLSPQFASAIRLARQHGLSEVECFTNGLMFAYGSFLRDAVDAGLTRVRVKLFGGDAAAYDAHTHTNGHFASLERALANLTQPGIKLEVVGAVIVHRSTIGDLPAIDAFARRAGLDSLVYQVPVSGLPVGDLTPFTDVLGAHLADLAQRGLSFAYGGL